MCGSDDEVDEVTTSPNNEIDMGNEDSASQNDDNNNNAAIYDADDEENDNVIDMSCESHEKESQVDEEDDGKMKFQLAREDETFPEGAEIELMGKCMACNAIGPLGNLCVECEDSGMIYEAFELGDNDPETIVLKEKDYEDLKNSTTKPKNDDDDEEIKKAYVKLSAHYMVVVNNCKR